MYWDLFRRQNWEFNFGNIFHALLLLFFFFFFLCALCIPRQATLLPWFTTRKPPFAVALLSNYEGCWVGLLTALLLQLKWGSFGSSPTNTADFFTQGQKKNWPLNFQFAKMKTNVLLLYGLKRPEKKKLVLGLKIEMIHFTVWSNLWVSYILTLLIHDILFLHTEPDKDILSQKSNMFFFPLFSCQILITQENWSVKYD